MKRKGPTFGHSQVDYRLGNIFKRVVKEFREADAAREKIDDESSAVSLKIRAIKKAASVSESRFAKNWSPVNHHARTGLGGFCAGCGVKPDEKNVEPLDH